MKTAYRIGILTLPLHYNYGGILQAYALQKYLHSLGYEAFLINRRKPVKQMPLRKKAKAWFLDSVVEAHTRDFTKKYVVPATEAIYSDADLKAVVRDLELDAVVVGSDQVWRIKYTGKIAFNFFLDFINDPKVRKISYAASFGKERWDEPEEITRE